MTRRRLVAAAVLGCAWACSDSASPDCHIDGYLPLDGVYQHTEELFLTGAEPEDFEPDSELHVEGRIVTIWYTAVGGTEAKATYRLVVP